MKSLNAPNISAPLVTISLPNRLDGTGIYSALAKSFSASGAPLHAKICFDFRALGFIEPVGVTSLANAVESLKHQDCAVFFSGLERRTEAVNYLDDSEFFKIYMGRPLRPFALLRTTTVPLQRVRYSESHSWLDTEMVTWLAARLNMQPSNLATIKVCMLEIFNNIQDHSGKDIGCIYAQHYPQVNTIVIAISDFGRGIPATMKAIYPEVTDAHSISYACQDGVTSRPGGTNLGAGLDLLVRQVVGVHKGVVNIRSGNGFGMWYDQNGVRRLRLTTMPGSYPGTLIEIRLKTNTIVPDPTEREELEW